MSNTQVISATTSTPAIPTTFTADTGVATPAANNLNVVGGAGIETTGAGDTLTISLTGGGSAIDTILTDSGAPAVVPDVNGEVSFVGGEGIDVTGQGPGNIVTISGEDATAGVNVGASNKGIAGYNSAHFNVTAGFVSLLGSGGGPSIQGVITDDGAPAVIADGSGNINILAGAGINVTGQGLGNTVTISAEGAVKNTVTTNDATPTTLITIPAGATPGTYALDVLVSAFNSSTPAGSSVSVWGGVRTTGVATTLTGVSDSSSNPEAALAGISAALAVSGNDILVQVTGLAATTINWSATARYEFVS